MSVKSHLFAGNSFGGVAEQVVMNNYEKTHIYELINNMHAFGQLQEEMIHVMML